MRAINYHSIILAAWMLSACVPVNSPVNISSITPTPYSRTPIATPLPQVSFPTPTPASVLVNCLPIEDPTPGVLSPLDQLLILATDSGELMRFDGNSLKFETFGDVLVNDLRGVSISPNHQLVAFASQSGSLVVKSNDDNILEMPWAGSWRNIAGWLDNGNLLISRRVAEASHDNLLVIDVFSDSQRDLVNEFRDIWNVYPYPDWGPFSMALFVPNSSLDRAVFASFPLGDREAGAIALWDLHENSIVTHLTGTAFFGKGPKWTLDGERFVTSNTLTISFSVRRDTGLDQELFSVDKSGNVDRTTFLTEYYRETEIGTYTWSDDQARIAFWLSAGEGTYPQPYPDPPNYTEQRVAVVDVSTKQTINYCIPGDQYSGLSPAPKWSPDGDYLVIENRVSEISSRIYLLDLAGGVAYKIAENAIPIGWMSD